MKVQKRKKMEASAVAVILLACAMPATAGGLSPAIAETADSAPPLTSVWEGFYAGGHLGYGMSDFTNFDSDEDNDKAWWGDANYGASITGFLGGGTVGYNFVKGNLLYGVEGELGLGAMEGSEIDSVAIEERSGEGETDEETRPETTVDISGYANIAARLGYIRDKTMFYGKAGIGFVRADVDWQDPGYYAGDDDCCGISRANDTLDMTGAVFGGGIAYALSDSMSLKLEYLRYAVGDTLTMEAPYNGDYDRYQQIIEVEDVDTLTIGVNWRF